MAHSPSKLVGSSFNTEPSIVDEHKAAVSSFMKQYFFFFNFFSMFIYFWDRERQSMNGGGAEREGDTESETGSRL